MADSGTFHSEFMDDRRDTYDPEQQWSWTLPGEGQRLPDVQRPTQEQIHREWIRLQESLDQGIPEPESVQETARTDASTRRKPGPRLITDYR
jgi:hypothetical protein